MTFNDPEKEALWYQGSAYISNPLGQIAHWVWKRWAIQKILGPSGLAIYDANGLSAFRQVEKTKELFNYS